MKTATKEIQHVEETVTQILIRDFLNFTQRAHNKQQWQLDFGLYMASACAAKTVQE